MHQLMNCSAAGHNLSMRKMAIKVHFFNTDAKHVLRNKLMKDFSNKIHFNNLM